MKKFVVVLASLMFVASNASAQDVAAAAPQQSQTTVVTTTVAPTAAAAVVESQPTVVVEASPLSVSRAEEIRKAREKTEVETEQRIVEKLEQSRMEDEKRRQEAILGSFGTAKAIEVTEQPKVVAQPQVIVVPQQTAPVEAPKGASMDDVRAAVREELSVKNEVHDEKSNELNYVSGTVGMLNYDSADIETVGALGLTFGKIFDERWSVEVAAAFSNSYVEENVLLYREMEQWSLGVGTRFYFLTGRIRPSLGFMVNYVNRSYSDLQDGYGNLAGTSLDSWAIDYGFTGGVDFAVSKNFLVGIEYRYMDNMTYQYSEELYNTPAFRQSFGVVTPIEERGYDFWGFSAKYLF